MLEATLKAPVGWLPVPGWFTTSKITDETASTGSNHTNFQHGTGVTAGDSTGWFEDAPESPDGQRNLAFRLTHDHATP
ncbi:hypothetical protein ACFV2N_46305 [Streptomyces sp. NPDC059680]|uniref:hypothetical protein n=1 Tax=Streptomyces sp. NPDC059680 TaxID=3346904 RepID=UPI0036CCF052